MSTKLGPLGIPTTGAASAVAPPIVTRKRAGKPVTTQKVDWATLVTALGGIEKEKVPDYDMSNGRRFFQ